MSFKILFWGTFGSDLGVGLRVLRLSVRFLRVSLFKIPSEMRPARDMGFSEVGDFTENGELRPSRMRCSHILGPETLRLTLDPQSPQKPSNPKPERPNP